MRGEDWIELLFLRLGFENHRVHLAASLYRAVSDRRLVEDRVLLWLSPRKLLGEGVVQGLALRVVLD